ncbi:hypothetical protein BGZ98_005951 [Dissophora globulifera]|nr:hypothetical protein BGZ98_005951 [Dissophora globulifera]
MAAVPTLPFVVLNAHRPYSASDIIDAAVAAASSTPAHNPGHVSTGGRSSSSSLLSLKAPLRTVTAGAGSSEVAPISTSPLPIASGLVASPPISPSIGSKPGTSSSPAPVPISSLPSSLSPPSAVPLSEIQTRTLHPQVHYIFENDPLENEILESIPKSRCITLDLDPRSGVIKNVESFLTNLQVMDVKLVPFQAALTTPSLSSSINSLTTAANPQQQQLDDGNKNTGFSTQALGKAGLSGPSSLQNSISTSTAKMSRLPSDRNLTNQSGDGDSQSIKSVKNDDKAAAASTPTNVSGAKDWTLVIEAVEIDEGDQESDSELLEQSLISSLSTDMAPEEYLPHCDALLKSFTARNLLVQKVIDFTAANS